MSVKVLLSSIFVMLESSDGHPRGTLMNILASLMVLVAVYFLIGFLHAFLQPSLIIALNRLFPRDANGRLSLAGNVGLSFLVILITAATIGLIIFVKWPK